MESEEGMRLACHQSDFIPWLPFFEKMHQSDIFVILTEVQFKKNGYMNRTQVYGEWWTNPIEHGLLPIMDKYYTTGQSLLSVNMQWIYAIAGLLNIDTRKIKFDFPTDKKGTERIIEICKYYKADEYLTNPEAMDKYLDEKLMNDNGIKVIPFVSKYKKHVFELFDEIGIQATRELLNEPESGKEVQKSREDNSQVREPNISEASVVK